jgi:[ribosomal protein S18]-alanine N-acetyltransferase
VIRATHAAAMAAIHADAFPPADAWSADSIAKLLRMPGAVAFLDPAGGMVMARVTADEAEILTLAVASDARRQGLGRRLLTRAAREVRDAGATRLFLEVAEANNAARTLYVAAGFSECGRRPRYYSDGSDALVLHRRLTSSG